MERYEVVNLILKPADLMLSAQLGLLDRAGLLNPLQDGIYATTTRLMRLNFEKMNNLEVIGLDRIPSGGVIFASNHQSWDDVQTLAGVSPRPIHFMAKEEFRHWPIMRQLVDLSRSFYIDRTGSDRSGLQKALDWLAAGDAIGMYPEGTIPGEEDLPRSKVEPATALLRGRSGVTRLAILSGCPVVPVGVSGTSAVFPPEMFPRLEVLPLPRREKITIRFGEPISLANYERQIPDAVTLRQETDRIMARISDLVDHHRQWVPLARFTPELLERHPGDARRLGVLLLHGFTSAVKCVAGLVPTLEKHGFPYQMPILAGHGTQYTDLAGIRYEDWIRDGRAALERLLQDCDRVAVVGLSMGGLVAAELAATHPEQVAAFIPIAPASRFLDPLAPYAANLARLVKFWPSPNSYRDSICAKKNENYLKFATDAFASLVEFGPVAEARLPQIKCPSLVIHSRRDQIVAPEAAETFLDRLGTPPDQKELVWFNRSGHEMLLDLEADEVMAIVEEFLLKQRRALRLNAEPRRTAQAG